MSRAIRSVSALAIAASTVAPTAAAAREQRYAISIAGGDLADALATLAAQTGASVGVDISLRGLRGSDVRGRMTAFDAVRRLLRGARLDAVRIGPDVFRIVVRSTASATGARSDETVVTPDVVVTARKLSEALSRVAAPVSVYIPAGATPGDRTSQSAPGIREVASAVEGLSVTNLGSGRDRPFIRGIADSPFNGFGQTTVSVNIDEARVTYDAPEPGLRLIDVARVEVLKGPQGPLYGTGALGGVYRIVTNRPTIGATSMTTASGITALTRGGAGADAEAVVNLPLIGNTAALRLVGYVGIEPGWIDDATGKNDVNSGIVRGARIGVRVAPVPGWTVDVGASWQRVELDDSQYVDRDAEDLSRRLAIREPSASSFRLVQAVASGPVGTLRLTVASSYAWQDRMEVFDASASAALAPLAARSYRDGRRHRVFDQEVRIESDNGQPLTWIAGISYVSATTRATGDIGTADGPIIPYFQLHRAASETAAFADASLRVAPRLRLGVGIRTFVAKTTDERREELVPDGAGARTLVGVTPSAALTFELAPDRLFFARIGTAFRPGGLDLQNARTGRYDADDVRSIDIGARMLLADARLSLEVGGFRSVWSHVQSDYLEADGLVATRNAGDALIVGGEASATWQAGAWRFAVGAGYQRGRLERAANGSALPEDARLPVVPDVTARWEVSSRIAPLALPTRVYVGGNYTGAARLSFDDGLDRAMGGFASFRGGVTMAFDDFDIRLEAENLLDARADTFAFGNPFSIRAVRQYTPLRPRSFRIGFARRF